MARKQKKKEKIAKIAKKEKFLNKIALRLIILVASIIIIAAIVLFILLQLGNQGSKILSYVYSSVFYIISGLVLFYILIFLNKHILKLKYKTKSKDQNIRLKSIVTKSELKKSISKLNKEKSKIKSLEFSYFILFIFSFAAFIYLYFYGNIIIIIFDLLFMFISLFGYRVSTRSKETKQKSFFRFFRRKQKDDQPKEKDKEVVKELPKDLKVSMGKYETELDLLYKFVEQKGKVKISAIAKYLKIDKSKVEEWANILEGNKLLKIHYPAIGEPELIKWSQ